MVLVIYLINGIRHDAYLKSGKFYAPCSLRGVEAFALYQSKGIVVCRIYATISEYRKGELIV